jgi:hypothetical protein
LVLHTVSEEEDIADEELRKAWAKKKPKQPKRKGPAPHPSFKRTELEPDAPAPQLAQVVAEHGADPTEMALCAWEARVNGAPIVDVAHELGLSIGAAKVLIKEAHAAIFEDLKENLNLNRQLDLDRVDGILRTYYPLAKAGDTDAANVTMKALGHRAKLVGLEAPPDPGRSNPQAVLVWIQNQIPSINKLVDALPLELPPAAPL